MREGEKTQKKENEWMGERSKAARQREGEGIQRKRVVGRKRERKKCTGGETFLDFLEDFWGDFLPRYINKTVPTVFLK